MIRGLRIHPHSSGFSRFGLSLISGAALVLAFPTAGLSLVAWIALVPLLIAIERQPISRVIGYAWLQGFVFYLGVLYWIEIEFHDYVHWSQAAAIVPLLFLSTIMAFFSSITFVAAEFVRRRARISMLVTLPVAWTAVEWVRGALPMAFPWDFLGYVAYRNLRTIQFAEFTGVYGLSALIVLVNATLYLLVATPHPLRMKLRTMTFVTGIVLVVIVYGAARRRQLDRTPATGKLKVAMVQGNIPQSEKWDPAALPSTVKVYFDATKSAARNGAELIIWPETATSFLFQPNDAYPAVIRDHGLYRQRLLDLAGSIHTPILFGAPAIYLNPRAWASVRNRAYLVSRKGEIEGFYDKIQLVPFGEYIPAPMIFGRFVHHILVESIGEFTPGYGPVVFDVNGAKLGVLICYESIFPDLTRRAANAGANILVNITNDAWFGDSSAPYHLLAMTVFRAIENRVPVVRVGNTGISAVISPTGRIAGQTKIFSRTTELQTVSWRRSRSFYSEHGDIFAETCFLLLMFGVFAGVIMPLFSDGNSAD